MKTSTVMLFILAAVLLVGGQVLGSGQKSGETMPPDSKMTRTAVFAGGCFWCTEADFQKVEGVVEAVSGYIGGKEANATYNLVAMGATEHLEAVQIRYDPAKISYEQLLDIFWRHIDPTDPGGQFVDRGAQYRSAIFYATDEQKRLAVESKKALAASGRFDKPIATEIRPLTAFYRAEDYHQDFYLKKSAHYYRYRSGSGRDQFIRKVWGDMKPAKKMDSSMGPKLNSKKGSEMNQETKYTKPSDEVLRNKLTRMQYQVTQHEGTEPPFNNEYWDNKAEGIYVDIVSGEPLFSSTHKYRSGTGWPSFYQPLEPDNIVEKTDNKLLMPRTEVRSKHASSHLGHVFEDGPKPTGLRYCINSAALRFIPKEKLAEEGYGKYLKLFN